MSLDQAIFSVLFFQYLKEGLILGESSFEEQVTIDDTEADHIHIEEIFNAKKHIACQKLHSFYTSTGETDLNALQTLLGDVKPEGVIGWYKQRRNTEQQMTLREKTVHRNLMTALSNPHLIFLLLTPSYFTTLGSTHKTEFAAYVKRCSQLTNVPVLVNNLGLLDPVSYCKAPALCSAVGYNLTMKKHRSKFFSSDGCLNEVADINGMNDSLQSELYNMSRDVENSERELETLKLEVTALRRRVKEQKQNRLLKELSNPHLESKRNILLHEAVRALFGSSPLFQSQTLTTSAFPILDFCYTLQSDKDTWAEQSERLEESGEHTELEQVQRKRLSRKRLTEMSHGSYNKRKKI